MFTFDLLSGPVMRVCYKFGSTMMFEHLPDYILAFRRNNGWLSIQTIYHCARVYIITVKRYSNTII